MADSGGFSAVQELAILNWWDCKGDHKAIADKIGVGKRSVERWAAIPAFKARVDDLLKTPTELAIKKLVDASSGAVDTLTRMAQGGDASAVQAAAHILKAAKVYVERTEQVNIDYLDKFWAGYMAELERLLDEHCADAIADNIKQGLNDWAQDNR